VRDTRPFDGPLEQAYDAVLLRNPVPDRHGPKLAQPSDPSGQTG
jgi:hypothetical protein